MRRRLPLMLVPAWLIWSFGGAIALSAGIVLLTNRS
jgi:hypothetical protein